MRPHLVMFAFLLGAAGAACTKNKTPISATASAVRPGVKTEADCRACNGKWGVHGMMDEKSCLCPAKDAGKRCKDGLECEGECLVVEGQTEVVDKGPPPRGFFVGKCSPYDKIFGCYKMLLDGALAQGPTALDEPAQEICID
jgi:hypothetical protein